jgi:hypothetical protein
VSDDEKKAYDPDNTSVYEVSKKYSLDDPFVRGYLKVFGSKTEQDAAYVAGYKQEQKDKK